MGNELFGIAVAERMQMLAADYLIVGSGAAGMTFADQLLTETDATVIIVDRHHMPGGHWNDAYPFVRLHQPSAFYGVGSRQLGSDRIDEFGLNKGFYELASAAEIVSYFDKLMNERFLPSGRVQYFPMCEYHGDDGIISRLSGARRQVTYNKRLVLANFLDTQVPSTHKPSFPIDAGVKLVTPNKLPALEARPHRYVIVGGGKTAMDVGVWLLQMGVPPAKLRWIVPRDSWVQNRETAQPGEVFHDRTVGGMAHQLEAAAEATSVDDLFEQLERRGQVLRIDRTTIPTVFRGATLSALEVEVLRSIKDVVRKGYVSRIERNKIVLEKGTIDATPDDLYVDCTAKAFGRRIPVPVFDRDRITLQPVRAWRMSFSAAVIGHVESAYEADSIKNDLCVPIPTPDVTADWPRDMLADLQTGQRWASDKALRSWMANHRLTGAGFATAGGQPSPESEQIRERMKEARPKAEVNLKRLIGR